AVAIRDPRAVAEPSGVMTQLARLWTVLFLAFFAGLVSCGSSDATAVKVGSPDGGGSGGGSQDSGGTDGSSGGRDVTDSGAMEDSTSAGAPTISSFAADPSYLPEGGGQVTLSWAVAGATSVELDQGIGAVSGTSRRVDVTKTTTFTLKATN